MLVELDEADLDVLPQEPIDEDDIIGLHWEDIAHASTGICVHFLFIVNSFYFLSLVQICCYYNLSEFHRIVWLKGLLMVVVLLQPAKCC